MKVLTRVAQVDDSKCVGCRMCEMQCPTKAISIDEKAGGSLPPRTDTMWNQQRKSEMINLPSERKHNIAEVALGMAQEQATVESQKAEATAHVDKDRCVDCALCVEYCTYDAVKMVPLDEKDQRIIAYRAREEQRPAILEMCKKAHLYPLDLLCECNLLSTEEVAAAILDGYHTVEDITLVTGARSGPGGRTITCRMLCHAKIIRLLKAAGIEIVEPASGQWHAISTDLWNIPQEIADKYPAIRMNIEQNKLWDPQKVESVETAWGLKKKDE
jgi:Fe-S-cluster-containing hydrogenase component 2